MYSKELGLKLKEIRESNHVTQSALAADLGISRSAVASIECGLRKPKVEHIWKYKEIFNLNGDFIDCFRTKNNFIEKNCFDLSKLNCRGVKLLYDYYVELLNNEEYVKKP